MKHFVHILLLSALIVLSLTSCDSVFDIHPYDSRVKGTTDLNAKNINPAKRNVFDLKNETCKNREKRNVLKNSHTRHFKTTKKQSKTGCFYSFER